MKDAVTITRTEYRQLTGIAERYDRLRRAFTAGFFEEPSTTSAKEAMKALKGTGKYNANFLKSVQQGMKESSFFS